MTYDIIVIGNDNILDTIDSILKQTHAPDTIRIVIDNLLPVKEIYKSLNVIIPDNISWYLHQTTSSLSRGASIDIAADKCDSTYYAVFNAGSIVPKTFLQDIDAVASNKKERFILLEPDSSGNGLVVHMVIHKMLKGHRLVLLEKYDDKEGLAGDDIIEKTKYIAEKNHQSYLIKKVEDICQRI